MTCRSMVCIYSSVRVSFYCQGLTLECNCSQLPEAWLPAAETPHTGVRPWKQRYSLTEKEMRSIDLPGHLCDPTGARAGHRIDAGPASYPRGVLRGERPERVLVSFARSKETPSGASPPGWQACAKEKKEGNLPPKGEGAGKFATSNFPTWEFLLCTSTMIKRRTLWNLHESVKLKITP